MYRMLCLYVLVGYMRIAGTGSLSILREALFGGFNNRDPNLAHLKAT